MKFAAFIITYERPLLILSTINQIFAQTFPPQKILVIDNSLTDSTEKVIRDAGDDRVEYVKMGFNGGPAGAAAVGLRRLAEEGYDWIHWADDNDPPRFPDCFECLLKKVDASIGVIGAVGSKFNWRTGLRERYKDSELHGLLSVDAIGGNFCMIVNSKAISDATLPDTKLFFGLEEFEFCQKIKSSGFRICVDGDLLYRHRQTSKMGEAEKKPSLVPRRSYETLKRDYYSYRNGIYLMVYRFRNYRLAFLYAVRAFAKIPFGFVKGFKFGMRNAYLLGAAVFHGIFAKMGRVF
jgi:GT2 family glycosyltransferase